jgi:ACS family hexuronate transporter-like MFS transporter
MLGGAVGALARRGAWTVVALLFASSFLNYLDRQTLSILKPTIKTEFGLDDAGYALLVNAFTFTYAGAYILSGWVVDRLGARVSLTIFIVGWSLATVGCGLVSSLFAFGALRALLGLMEPGHQPCAIRAMTLWAPPPQRATMMSLCGAGGTVGAIVAAPLIAWLTAAHSWRAAFIIPGACGFTLAGVWWWIYRDPPETGRVTERAETASDPTSAALPWRKLWAEPALWGIVLARFISDPVWYYCLFWMPGYFQEKRGLSLEQTGAIAWIPFMAANLGGFAAAAFSDRLARTGWEPFRARRGILMAVSCAGPLAMLVPQAEGTGVAIALLSGVGVVCLTWLFLLGPLVSDRFHAGNVASVWSIAGAFGATGAILFNYFIGRASEVVGDGNLFLIMGVLHPLAAGILWLAVRPRAPKLA